MDTFGLTAAVMALHRDDDARYDGWVGLSALPSAPVVPELRRRRMSFGLPLARWLAGAAASGRPGRAAKAATASRAQVGAAAPTCACPGTA